MSRRRLAVLAATVVVALVPGLVWSPAAVMARPDPAMLADDVAAAGPGDLAWMSTGHGIFSVDAAARTVRFRGCGADTGRVADPDMRVRDGVASGKVIVGNVRYRYRIPLVGRAFGVVQIHTGGGAARMFRGQVVTDPQPPTDPRLAENLVPLAEELERIVKASEHRRAARPEERSEPGGSDRSPNAAGVTVRDLSGRFGDGQIAVNGTFRPKAASVIKLWILAELLRRVDCGSAAFTDGVVVLPSDVVDGTGELQHETFPQTVTLFRLAEYMIKYSDNTAANVLIDYLGGFGPINALIDSMNQRETVLARKMLDTEAAMRGEENFTSADDVVSLLGAVWDGELLSAPSRDLMLHFMLEQTINTKIPAALPPGVPVAHKTGELPDASHDVGYYLIPGTEIAVAFLTGGVEATGAETVRQLARAVYNYL